MPSLVMPSASTRILGSYLIGASPMNSRMLMYLLPLLVLRLLCLCLVPRLVYLVPRLVCLVPRLVCLVPRLVCRLVCLGPLLVCLVPRLVCLDSYALCLDSYVSSCAAVLGASTRMPSPSTLMNRLVLRLPGASTRTSMPRLVWR